MQFLEWKWWPNDLECQGQWPSLSIPAERITRCIFGASLVILAQIHCKLSHRQIKFPTIQNGQNDHEGQGQWPSVSIPTESIPGCMFRANCVILARICGELSRWKTKLPRIQSQNDQSGLEVHSQWPPFSIPAVNVPECTFGANLGFPAKICDELWCRQDKVYGRMARQTDKWTDRQTDRQTLAKTIPFRPERPRGKKVNTFMSNLQTKCDI